MGGPHAASALLATVFITQPVQLSTPDVCSRHDTRTGSINRTRWAAQGARGDCPALRHHALIHVADALLVADDVDAVPVRLATGGDLPRRARCAGARDANRLVPVAAAGPGFDRG